MCRPPTVKLGPSTSRLIWWEAEFFDRAEGIFWGGGADSNLNVHRPP